MTDNKKESGLILFDGECGICTGWVHRWGPLLRDYGFHFSPLQECEPFRSGKPIPPEMRFVTPDGHEFGGAEAILQICRRIWWTWPVYIIGMIPGVRHCLRASYSFLAARRHCIGNACTLPRREPALFAWIPLLVLPAVVILARDLMEAWIFMWALCFAMFFGCKWTTWWPVRNQLPLTHSFGYLLFWVGMDPRPFRARTTKVPVDHSIGLILLKIGLGALLLFVLAPSAVNPLAIAWIGMTGIILMLHFGTFDLLAAFWRRRGIPVEPLMHSPLAATSLTEFWGRRWNRGFHDLAHAWIFKPVARKAGMTAATLTTFLVSGVVHDLVISLPARGGYGLPSLYFLLQGLGVLLERSRRGRELRVGHGLRGWLLVLVFTAGPAFWLFHPPFIHNVILPMLEAIGALQGTP